MEKSKDTLDPATWVEEYGDYLFRYAVSRLRDADSATEVVQEAFVAGLEHVEQYSGKGTEKAWLLGILKRKIVDHVRGRNRAGKLAAFEGQDDPSAALFDRSGSWRADVRRKADRPLDSLERQEFWGALRHCLDRLPSRQADVFVLREMEQLATEDICKELGIPASNCWVLLYRARLRLANCMKSPWQEKAE